MLKAVAFILCFVLVFSALTGCSKKNVDSSELSVQVSGEENKEAQNEIKTSGSKPVMLSAFVEYENGQPKLVWKNIKGRQGFSAIVILKDENGKIVEKQEGITEDGYTIKASLTEGKKYTAEFCYVTPSGKRGIFGGIDKSKITYTHVKKSGEYSFDYAMPLDVLNNCLSKAITYGIYSESDSTSGRFNKVMAADAQRAILNVWTELKKQK